MCEATSSSPATANCRRLDRSLTRESSGSRQSGLRGLPSLLPTTSHHSQHFHLTRLQPRAEKNLKWQKKGEADSFAAVSTLKQLGQAQRRKGRQCAAPQQPHSSLLASPTVGLMGRPQTTSGIPHSLWSTYSRKHFWKSHDLICLAAWARSVSLTKSELWWRLSPRAVRWLHCPFYGQVGEGFQQPE